MAKARKLKITIDADQYSEQMARAIREAVALQGFVMDREHKGQGPQGISTVTIEFHKG